MKKIALSLLTLALVTACQSSKTYQSTLTEGVDYHIAPQHDFYRYVNGKWLDTAQIPADRTSWGTLAGLNEINEKRSLALLQTIMQDKALAQDPRAVRLKALYQTYTDLPAREQQGLTPIQAQLDRIDQISNLHELSRYLIEETKQGKEHLISWSVFADLKNSRQNAVYFGNQELGLSKEYYQKSTPENQRILAAYEAYVEKMLHQIGEPDAKAKANAIVAYESQIAQTLFTNEEERDIEKRYNRYSMQALAQASRHLNIADILREVGVNSEEIIAWEPRWLQALDRLINPEQLPTIKAYLRFLTVSDAAPYLTQSLEQAHFAFFGTTLVGQKQPRPLENRALRLINSQIGQEFAQFYVEKFFPATAKRDLTQMARYLVNAYHQRIDSLDWMSADTKAKAKQKLDKFVIEIGYPNKWKDYRTLSLNSVEQGGNLYQNLRAIAAWNYQEALKKIGQPVDLSEWGMLPQVVNASYSPVMNRIVFPAGILQAPLYDIQADPAVNFGAIGAIIGHELTHGFDDSGSKFDGDGNLIDWWNAEDRQKFEALAEQLVREFDRFEVAPRVFVNGRFTLGENIADLGGLSIAYDALKQYEQDHGHIAPIEGLTQDQRFFMSWARSWRNKATVQALTHQVKSDPHAPAQFRALSPVLNINGFHQAFSTQPGEAMYKPINERIKIW